MAEIDMRTVKVLVIDDEPFIRQLLIRALAEIEINETVGAGNGADGLARVKEIGGKLDVILCDLDMPKMNGFEFVRRLRKLPDPEQANLPVVIVTGNSQEESVRSAIDLGISGFLVKPVTSQALQQRIEKAILSQRIDPDFAKE